MTPLDSWKKNGMQAVLGLTPSPAEETGELGQQSLSRESSIGWAIIFSRHQLARCHREVQQALLEGRDADLLSLAGDGVQRFPQDAELRLLYGAALIGVDDNQAVHELSMGVELAPNEPWKLVRASQLLLGLDATRGADVVRQVEALNSAEPAIEDELAYLRGKYAMDAGRLTEAETYFRDVLGRDPDDARYVAGLVECLCLDGRDIEARQLAADALPRVARPSIVRAVIARYSL